MNPNYNHMCHNSHFNNIMRLIYFFGTDFSGLLSGLHDDLPYFVSLTKTFHSYFLSRDLYHTFKILLYHHQYIHECMKGTLQIVFLRIVVAMEGVHAFPSILISSFEHDSAAVQKRSFRQQDTTYTSALRGYIPTISASVLSVDEQDSTAGTSSSCPQDVPDHASACDPAAFYRADHPDESLCSYNYLTIHSESDEELGPTILCSCSTDGLWSCGIHPQYMLAITTAPMT